MGECFEISPVSQNTAPCQARAALLFRKQIWPLLTSVGKKTTCLVLEKVHMKAWLKKTLTSILKILKILFLSPYACIYLAPFSSHRILSSSILL